MARRLGVSAVRQLVIWSIGACLVNYLISALI